MRTRRAATAVRTRAAAECAPGRRTPQARNDRGRARVPTSRPRFSAKPYRKKTLAIKAGSLPVPRCGLPGAPRGGLAAAPLTPGLAALGALDALAQRVHQVDDVARFRPFLRHLDRLALRFAAHQRLQGVLVLVLELRRVEVCGLGVEDVLGELDGLARQPLRLDAGEIRLGLAQLIGIAQRCCQHALVHRLDRNDVLAVRHHDTGERHAALVLHGVANNRESLFAHLLAGRREIVRLLQIALIDFVLRHEAVDVDRVRALDLDCLELILFDLDILALAELVAASLVVPVNDLAGLLVDHLLAQAIACAFVDLVEMRLLGLRGRRIEQDRAGDEGKPEIASPIGARRHGASDAMNTLTPGCHWRFRQWHGGLVGVALWPRWPYIPGLQAAIAAMRVPRRDHRGGALPLRHAARRKWTPRLPARH